VAFTAASNATSTRWNDQERHMNVQAADFFVGERSGMTRGQLRAGEAAGRWRRVGTDTYRNGSHDPTPLERALAVAVVTHGVIGGPLCALLLDFDAGGAPVVDVTIDRTASTDRRGVRHRLLAPDRIITVAGFRCTDGLQTLVDLAHRLDDDRWEQALEFALRKEYVTIEAITAELPHLGRQRIRGTRRIRRVVLRRPAGAPPTESLLETIMVQIARLVPGLPPPLRQVEVYDRYGNFVARVDLAWPELGLFIELDGEHHKDQPVYDANRESAVVAATGWLCARFTWTECTTHRVATARRLDNIVRQARNRPVASAA
jgi:hypothetical protein